MKNGFRWLSILFCVVLIAGLFPAHASAAQTLTSVVVSGVETPRPGVTAIFGAGAGGYAGYDVNDKKNTGDIHNGVLWLDATTGKYLALNAKFVAGHDYEVWVYLIADSGYEFATKSASSTAVTATLEGKKAEASELVPNSAGIKKEIAVYYKFTNCKYLTVTSVSLAVTAPVAGEYAAFSALAQNSGCTVRSAYTSDEYVKGVSWYDSTAKKYLTASDRFVVGHKYIITVQIQTVQGCVLAVDNYNNSTLSAEINDKKANVASVPHYSPSILTEISYVFPACTAEQIKTLEIVGVVEPVGGAKMQKKAAVSDSRCKINESGVYWTDLNTHKTLGLNDSFISGHSYEFQIAVTVDPSYYSFVSASSVTATVNGKTASVSGTASGMTLKATFTAAAGAPAVTQISSLSVTGLYPPSVGRTPEYAATYGNPSQYYADFAVDDGLTTLSGITWLKNGAAMRKDEEFVGGNTYSVMLSIRAKSGYEFKEDKYGNIVLNATVNGNATYDILNTGVNRQEIVVTYEFPKLAGGTSEIKTVALTGSVAAGTVLNSTLLKTTAAGVSSVSCEWRRNGEVLAENTKAASGSYSVLITLQAANGYIFTSATDVSALGKKATLSTMSKSGTTLICLVSDIAVSCDHKANTSGWSKDANNHWKECSVCGDRISEGVHNFNAGVVKGANTVYTCTVCGYEKTVANGSAGTVKVTLPTLDFPKTLGDVCRETGVELSGDNPSLIVFTFKSADGTDSVQYSLAKQWHLSSGASAEAVMNKRLAAFTEYTLTLQITTGKQVAEKDVNVINNSGNSLGYDLAVRNQSEIVVTAKYMTGSNIVSLIGIDQVAAPVVGMLPSDSFHLENAEGISPVSLAWNTSERFVCEKSYQATVTVRLDDGYVFAAETQAFVEGCADVRLTLDVNTAQIVCIYPAIPHAFGDWTAAKAATETEKGERTRTCPLCGKTETEEIPVLPAGHTHSYAQKRDAEGHWTECDCGEKGAKEAHTFNEEGVCTVCGYDRSSAPAPVVDPSADSSEKPSDGPSVPASDQSKALTWLWIALGALFAVLVAAIIAVLLKLKKTRSGS